MSVLTARAGNAPHVAPFRRLIEERKGQLRRIARVQAPAAFETALRQGHTPRFSFGSWLKETASDRVSGIARAAGALVQHTASGLEKILEGQAKAATRGIEGVARGAGKVYPALERAAMKGIAGAINSGVRKGLSWLPSVESLPLGPVPARAGDPLRTLKAHKPSGAGPPHALEEIEHVVRRPPEPPRAQRPLPEPQQARAESDARLHLAWEQIGAVSRKVQKFEVESGQAQRAVEELLDAGQAHEAGLRLMGLGARCDEIDRAIYAVRTKVQSFAGALGDPDAAVQVKKVLAEARQAKADLQALQAKYRGDPAASAFLTGGGIQDKLIDEVLRKLEPAAAQQPDKATAAKPGAARRIENGLAAIRRVREQALKAGERVDSGLEKVERGLSAGMKVGKRVESGLEKVAELADRVSGVLGETSPLGRLAHRIGEGAGLGHEKLEEALGVAEKGQEVLGAHFVAFLERLHGLGETPARKDEPAQPSIDQLIEQILGGRSGPIHADRVHDIEVDLEDLDAAALDTWIGSGQGTKPFSDVFGAFLPAEGAVVLRHHRGRSPRHRHGKWRRGGGEGFFFAKLSERLEGFAERIGGWASEGSRLLGKGKHAAGMAMHGLSRIEGAAGQVQEAAGQAERFLDRMGLHWLAGTAGKIGGVAGWVDEEAKVLHGGLKTADAWMGKGKKAAGKVEHGAEVAAGIFDEASHGRSGKLVNLFRAASDGDGIDGKLSPDRVTIGSALDEPRRLDVSTLSRMESYLGGDFSGVRIHTGAGAGEVTRRFNAEAVTVKDHVFFAPGRFNPSTVEGQRLIAHELTHVLQKGRTNLDVRTAEGEALRAEHGYGRAPPMETLDLRRPEPGFRIAADGEGQGGAAGIHTAKRTRSRGHEAGGKDALPDGEEMLEQISGRVYELLMEELEQAFESR